MVENQIQKPVENQPSSVPQQPLVKEQHVSHTSFYIEILVLLIVLLILLFAGYRFLSGRTSNSPAGQSAVNNQQNMVSPVPEIIDTAPAIPVSMKAKVVVHHSDSTFTTYLVPVNSVQAYTKTLPPGDSIVSITNPR